MNNDRGIAICKSMLGYKLFYSNDTPKTLNVKSDEFVSLCYVKFESESKKDENLNKLAQQTLVKWEEGDKETIQLWKKVMKWVFEGYKITYKNYKIGNYDEEYFESQIYTKGKDIVTNALKNKVKGFEQEEDGAIYCDLSDVGYDKKYLLRGDNTTLYMTQDLYLAYLKDEQFSPDLSFFIVGKDQEYHFKVLFEILERLGYGGVKKNYHFAYGYVYNRDGKKFSSRKGEVVGADWILNHIISKAKENLISKEISKNLPDAELEKRANIIGYGALAFSMLKTNPLDDICFDIDKALSFEGETGPYVQYTYARINSILKKANYKNQKDIDYSKYENKETSLIKLLKEYPQIIQEASNKYKPSHIANYLIKVSQSFNEFYQNSPILNGDKELIEPRLELCSATSRIIKEGLDLLDIQTLDEM
jgi:arginyl-tRNA synthetase